MKKPFLLAALFALAPLTVHAQDPIFGARITSFTTDGNYVRGAAAVGDVDGDGYGDVGVGHASHGTGMPFGGGGTVYGFVALMSGRDGRPFYERRGAPNERVGSSIVGLGDLDGDGFGEVLLGGVNRYEVLRGQPFGLALSWSSVSEALAAVSIPDRDGDQVREVVVGRAGVVEVRSGATGAVLLAVAGGTAAFGESVIALDDLTGDGVVDLLVGEPIGDGQVHLISGTDGTTVASVQGVGGELLGNALADLGDVNGDGVPEVAVGAPEAAAGGVTPGRVVVYSLGGTATVLYELTGEADQLEFGAELCAVADVTGDGVPELGVAAMGFPHPEEPVRLHDGATGVELWRSPTVEHVDPWLETGNLTSGDVDGDGLGDLVYGDDLTGWVLSGSQASPFFRHALASRRVQFPTLGFSIPPSSVELVGDLDGDGRSEFAVGRGAGAGGSVEVHLSTGELLYELSAPGGDSFGDEVRGLGDLDGDGVPDFGVGSPRADAGGTERGHVRFYSGADASLIAEFVGTDGDHMGEALAPAGDHDGDGLPDVLVGVPRGYEYFTGDLLCSGVGAVEVRKGSDGSLLHRIDAATANTCFGYDLDLLGDLNGDGVEDFVIGVPAWSSTNRGRATIRSGANFSELFGVPGGFDYDHVGRAVSRVGDVDGDGTPDVLIGSDLHGGSGTQQFPGWRGIVAVVSGATGSLIRAHAVYGTEGTGSYGSALAPAGDADQDGHADYLIADAHLGPGAEGPGAVYLHSGATGDVIRTERGRSTKEGFGRFLAGGADVDGDGREDWIVGSAGSGRHLSEVVHVRTLAPLGLTSPSNFLRSTEGGEVALLGYEDAALAGSTYWILGSLSGVSPGFSAFGVAVPLNPDPFLLDTVAAPNAGPLAESLGTIAFDGTSRTTFTVPADPALAGITATFAKAVLAGPPLSVVSVSNPLGVTIVP